MLLLLVRHGRAGSKQHWGGDDRLRPLSRLGLIDAEALEHLLAAFAPTRILSSPYVRCVQTVKPLAKELELRIERSKRLVPSAGRTAEAFVRRVSKDKDGAVVLCTHGEVIRDLQKDLSRSFPDLVTHDFPREKGSVWVLEREADRFIGSTYLPPGSTSDAIAVSLRGRDS